MALVQHVVVVLPFFLVFTIVQVGAVRLELRCLTPDPKKEQEHGPARTIFIETDEVIRALTPTKDGPLNPTEIQLRERARVRREQLPLHIPDHPNPGTRQTGPTYRILMPPIATNTFDPRGTPLARLEECYIDYHSPSTRNDPLGSIWCKCNMPVREYNRKRKPKYGIKIEDQALKNELVNRLKPDVEAYIRQTGTRPRANGRPNWRAN